MKFIGIGTQQSYKSSASRWIGDNNELLDLDFFPLFSVEKIKREFQGLWRYLPFLPLTEGVAPVSLGEAVTPIISIPLPDNRTILVKQEQLFPTGSYKDRGAAVLISFLKELGAEQLIQDSSGNAGASIAAYAAAAGIGCTIYLPEETAPGKILQMEAYGAEIKKIKGGRFAAALAAKNAAKGNTYASHCYHPVFFHGTKTFAYELAEQLNWKMPDAIILPAGNGTLILGAFIGFKEMLKAGVISHIPALYGIQSAACDPLTRQFNRAEPPQISLPTLAEGIAILNPIRANQMMQAIEDTGGAFISVTETQIEDAWKYLAKKGFFVEPTSAATLAGACELSKIMPPNKQLVSVFSGHGLKSSDKIEKILHK